MPRTILRMFLALTIGFGAGVGVMFYFYHNELLILRGEVEEILEHHQQNKRICGRTA